MRQCRLCPNQLVSELEQFDGRCNHCYFEVSYIRDSKREKHLTENTNYNNEIRVIIPSATLMAYVLENTEVVGHA